MKILVVEDEAKTASFLRQGLIENKFEVDVLGDGLEASRYLKQYRYDLIILDVMLPRRSGWELIQELRSQDSQTPVLFLTARDAIEERVKGLQLGADDYLIKPFAFSELLARIHTLLRRGQQPHSQQLKIDDLEIDLLTDSVKRSSHVIRLTPKEFKLLVLLIQHRDEILSRKFIAEKVWNIHFETDTNTIDVAVRRLRSKVDDPFSKKLIHTIRGIGYVVSENEPE